MAEDKPQTFSATCERFPNPQIGDAIAFHDGVFSTTDPAVWERLKQHEWWDILIKEGKPAAPAPAAAEPAVAGQPAVDEAPQPTEGPAAGGEKSDEESGRFGGVHRGSRGTR